MSAQHCSVKNGKKGKGTSHAQYVVGKGKYSEREDVLGVITGNMPEWAIDGVTFFVAADKHERLNGRSYKEVEFAIPREVADPVAYANDFAQKLLGKDFPYLAGVHSKPAADGLPNTHCHLMFSERKLDGHARGQEHFFKRADSKVPERGGCGKDRNMNKREFVQEVRDLHQSHAKAWGVDLDMRSNKARGLGPAEPKIGPAARRGPVDTYRDVIAEHVTQLRVKRKPKKAKNEPSFKKPNTERRYPARQPNHLYDLSECVLDQIGLRGEAEPAKLLPEAWRNDLGQPGQETHGDGLRRAERPAVTPKPAAGINTRSRYHPDNIKKEQEMATAKELELVAQATAKRAANKHYRPTVAELKAVTVVVDEQIVAKAMPAPEKTLVERFQAALEAAVAWVKGEGWGIAQFDKSKDQTFEGTVLYANEHLAIQKTSRGDCTIHVQYDFDKPLVAIKDCARTVSYKNGQGAVKPIGPAVSKGLAS